MKPQWAGLVGDVGGTNARLALVDEQGHARHPRIFACRQYASLADIVAEYMETTTGKKRPSKAVIAVAGPVLEGEIEFSTSRGIHLMVAGQLIHLAAGEPHSLTAHQPASALVTMCLIRP